MDKNRLTQFGQVLERLGIEHIPSYSPEARGRIERMFQTWQGRIPQEFADAGITDVHAANAYLRKHLIGRMNRNFKGKAREERDRPSYPAAQATWRWRSACSTSGS
ncbi:MAG: hypothetical protein M9910_05110 [Kiritimatiellae bacterium]|nr:hypothetical protein [Kiritimatiellia bacterium]